MPGTWRPLTTQPSSHVERMLLLTDGTVFCHLGQERWAMLVPDSRGQYQNATWTSADSMHHPRRWFGASVLADGRVLVAFGWPNLSSGTSFDGDMSIEIFNPRGTPGRRWTLLAANPGWPGSRAAQVHMCPLADGRRVLVGTDIFAGVASDFGMSRQSSLYDIPTNTWRLVDPGAVGGSDLQSWTLLRDGSVLSTNGHPNDFRYIPDAGVGRWIPIGSGGYGGDVYIPYESPGILLPDGRVWVVSKISAETLFYHPPTSPSETGSWTAGPTFPDIAGSGRPENSRLAACVLPSGKVFCAVNDFYNSVPVFYEFDPFNGTGTIEQISSPELSETSNLADPGAVLMLLPTGEVLMSYYGQMHVFSPDADSRAPQSAWRPHLASPVGRMAPDTEYTARGHLFNGMTQAVYHNPWKNAGCATNYPIVRLANVATGTVRYLGTHHHTGLGVATGTTPHTTNFKVPYRFPDGEADFSIIANGIESNRIRIMIGADFMRIPEPHREFNRLIGNLADGPLFILGPHGIRPVPPFGPIDLPFQKIFRQRILKAYEHIFTGLMLMNAQHPVQPESMEPLITHENGTQQLAKRQIEYGLSLMRRLNDQLDQPSKKNKYRTLQNES